MPSNQNATTHARAKPTFPVTQWDSDLTYRLIAEMSKKENAKVLFGMKEKNEVHGAILVEKYLHDILQLQNTSGKR